MLELVETKKSHAELIACMRVHYTQPKGLIGRSICYAIYYDKKYYGHIVMGSATMHLPHERASSNLNEILCNTFFHLRRPAEGYPCRNITSKILLAFERQAIIDWYVRYGDIPRAIETLVQPPRTGEAYLRVGYSQVGMTKGFTCERVKDETNKKWGTTKKWDYSNPQPKLVFEKRIDANAYLIGIKRGEQLSLPL